MTLAPAAVGARCSGPDRRGPRGIRGGHHARRSGLFDLHLASLLAPRPVDGLEGANDTQTLPRPASGWVSSWMQSRKCSHSFLGGSLTTTLGMRMSPSRMLMRKEENESIKCGSLRSSSTCLS